MQSAAAINSQPISREEFSEYVQLVVTDNQPNAEKTQQGVAGERRWFVNDLGAICELLIAGLCWGHMPLDLVSADLARGRLIKLRRRAWHLRSLVFVLSHLRGSELSSFEQRAVKLLAGQTKAGPRPTGRRT